jgi:protease IV
MTSSTDAVSTPAASSPLPASSGLTEKLFEELLAELRSGRSNIREQHRELVKDRKSERRWKTFFQLALIGIPLLGTVAYVIFFTSAMGFQWGPFGSVVGVVRIDGEISSQSLASARHIIPILEKAFANPSVKAVVLSIDSPGGAPVESERIYAAIERLKRKHQKPVVAVINNVGASAAYMIAVHADKIFCGRYSLVGSIGAIITAWDLHRAIERVDVTQHVYASGQLKALLNPFAPVSREADAKAKLLVSQVGATFLDEVKRARGATLKTNVDYGSGEIWGGQEAKDIGLVDGISTLDEVVAANWGLKTYDFGPSQDSFGLFSASLQGVAQTISDNLASRLAPSLR